MKTQYRAAHGARITDRQAQIYGEALEALKLKLGHDPTTDEIVAAARRPDSPLNNAIEWNVRKAAMHYWRVQARHLVGQIEVFVVYRNKQVPVRAWFNVKRHEEDPQRYVQAETVANSPYMRSQIVSYAIQELKDWYRRYKYYLEFRMIHVAITKTEKRINKRKKGPDKPKK